MWIYGKYQTETANSVMKVEADNSFDPTIYYPTPHVCFSMYYDYDMMQYPLFKYIITPALISTTSAPMYYLHFSCNTPSPISTFHVLLPHQFLLFMYYSLTNIHFSCTIPPPN